MLILFKGTKELITFSSSLIIILTSIFKGLRLELKIELMLRNTRRLIYYY